MCRLQPKCHSMLTFGWYCRHLSLRRLGAGVVAIFWMSIYDDKYKLFIRVNVEIIVVLKKMTCDVYWTVHHFDIWIKTDQLDVTCSIISLFNFHHVSNVSTSTLRSLRLISCVISWVVLLWFDVWWCYGVIRLGWCGILMQAEAVLQPT